MRKNSLANLCVTIQARDQICEYDSFDNLLMQHAMELGEDDDKDKLLSPPFVPPKTRASTSGALLATSLSPISFSSASSSEDADGDADAEGDTDEEMELDLDADAEGDSDNGSEEDDSSDDDDEDYSMILESPAVMKQQYVSIRRVSFLTFELSLFFVLCIQTIRTDNHQRRICQRYGYPAFPSSHSSALSFSLSPASYLRSFGYTQVFYDFNDTSHPRDRSSFSTCPFAGSIRVSYGSPSNFQLKI